MGDALGVAARVYAEIDGLRVSWRPARWEALQETRVVLAAAGCRQRRVSQPMREHYCGDGVPEASAGGAGASPSSDASSSADRVMLHSGTTTNLRHSHQT